MRALTVSEPYASLIASGEKWVENRKYRTSYRGPIAIHAGLGTQYLTRAQLREYKTGSVIAIANLVACVSMEETVKGCERTVPGCSRTWVDLVRHKHTEGPWCWILEDVYRIEPVAAKGMQQIWNWNNPELVVVA